MPRSNLPVAVLCAMLLLSSCGAASVPASARGGSSPVSGVSGREGFPSGRPLFVYTRGADECPDAPGGEDLFCDSGDPGVPPGLYDVAAVYPDGRVRTPTDDHISTGGRLSPDGSRIAFAGGERIVEDRNGEVVALGPARRLHGAGLNPHGGELHRRHCGCGRGRSLLSRLARKGSLRQARVLA